MTMGLFINSWRQADEISQAAFAKKLKISRANLCDIEKGRKLVSPDRALKFAKILDLPEDYFIILSLQDALRRIKLNYEVKLTKIQKKRSALWPTS